MESLVLSKGVNLPLSKDGQGLSKVNLAGGWDEKEGATAPGAQGYDLDLIFVALRGGVLGDSAGDILFYNSPKPNGKPTILGGALISDGDNLTGTDNIGTKDDETVRVDFSKVPAEISHLVAAIDIYDCTTRKQNFGQIENAFVRLVNPLDNTELARLDLTEEYSGNTTVYPGYFYRDKDNNTTWRFKANPVGTNAANVTEVAVGAAAAMGIKPIVAATPTTEGTAVAATPVAETTPASN
jgi:tellurium resistance protein TerD